jgi:hypothetical protein
VSFLKIKDHVINTDLVTHASSDGDCDSPFLSVYFTNNSYIGIDCKDYAEVEELLAEFTRLGLPQMDHFSTKHGD